MKKLLFALVLLFSLVPAFAQQKNKARLQAMYDSIKAAGIRHPEYVMGQCIQETGWLACKKCCLRYHNLFGFYIKGNKCKKFTSEADCIAYYKTWQDKRYLKWQKKHPKQDYYHFLKSVGYATGDKYTRELKPKVEWVKKNLKL
jgi:Mannosyl-glycoprotein endo-beta-N-acetylglucosaminidase